MKNPEDDRAIVRLESRTVEITKFEQQRENILKKRERAPQRIRLMLDFG